MYAIWLPKWLTSSNIADSRPVAIRNILLYYHVGFFKIFNMAARMTAKMAIDKYNLKSHI
jgi:hypothetical protein